MGGAEWFNWVQFLSDPSMAWFIYLPTDCYVPGGTSTRGDMVVALRTDGYGRTFHGEI